VRWLNDGNICWGQEGWIERWQRIGMMVAMRMPPI
jgi:hypothetical protein